MTCEMSVYSAYCFISLDNKFTRLHGSYFVMQTKSNK